MATPNGLPPGSAAPFGMGSNNTLQPSGHVHDMQHLWGLVEELSGILQGNREKWDELQTDMARIEADQQQNRGSLIEGKEPSEYGQNQSATEMSNNLIKADRKIEAYEHTCHEQTQLVTSYENAMQVITDKLRNYVHDQVQSTNGSYQPALLSTARNETLQAQLTHQKWQAAFSNTAENVRLAYREKSEQNLPFLRKIAALKEENRILRTRVGWEPASDDSDDENYEVAQHAR